MKSLELTYREKRGKVTRLLHIHVPVIDIGNSIAWYEQHFGLTRVQSSEVKAELAVLENGEIVYPTLLVTKTRSSHRLNYVNKNGRTRSIIMMHASNLEGLRDKMLQAGAHVTLPHSDQEDDGCGRFFEATDPSGNFIQVQANKGEPPTDHPRVEAIFNLELPVSDVRKSARFYAEVLGFNLIREPDDQLAIVKTGPYYNHRFGYHDVQEFGFFLFRHEERVALHFEVLGSVQECLIMQADDVKALHGRLAREENVIWESTTNHAGQLILHIIDPDGNQIKIIPKEQNAVNPKNLQLALDS